MKKNIEYIREYLWSEINPILSKFANRVVLSDLDVKFTVERHMNQTFLIRGYVSFTKTELDNEVAVLVDVLLKGGEIHLSADACTEDGEIIAIGPAAYVAPSITSEFDEALFSDWLRRLGDFLESIESVVRERIDGMST